MTRKATPADAPRNEAHFSPFSPSDEAKGMAMILSLMHRDSGFLFSEIPESHKRLCASLGVTFEVVS